MVLYDTINRKKTKLIHQNEISKLNCKLMSDAFGSTIKIVNKKEKQVLSGKRSLSFSRFRNIYNVLAVCETIKLIAGM